MSICIDQRLARMVRCHFVTNNFGLENDLGVTFTKIPPVSPDADGRGTQEVNKSILTFQELTQMEEKFRRMGLMSDDPTDEWDTDDNLLASISQKEHVEGQEWRAEI